MESSNEPKQDDAERGVVDHTTEKEHVSGTPDDTSEGAARTPDSSEIRKGTSKLNSNGSSNSEKAEFPKAFYCPITGKVFDDPVVTPEGLSFERTALGDDISADKLYENRALKTIIDETVEYKTSSGIRRFQHSVRQLSQQLITTSEYHRPLPDAYYCPITLSLIHVPVIDPEGYSYEEAAIVSWIRYNGASPVTRRALTVDELVPNLTLAALMEEEKGKSDDLVHPTFKQWKEEPAPVANATGDTGSSHGSLAPTVFPTTPEELEAANRLRRIRRYRRCHIWTIVAFVLAIMTWMVPVLATVLLVIILFGVALVTGCSSTNDDFTPN